MPIYWEKTKKRWRFTFNRLIHGHRYRASRLLPAGWSRTQADTYDRIESARLYALASGVEQQDHLIDEAVKLYLDHRLPQLRSRRSIAHSLALLAPYYAGRPLSELPRIAKQYADDSMSMLAPATIRNRIAYLRAGCRYAYKQHDLGSDDPGKRVSVPSVKNERQEYLLEADLNKLLSKCPDEEMRALLTLQFYTGLRWRSEILPLTKSQIVEQDGTTWIVILETKNGRPHMVPVHQAALWALEHIPFRYKDSHYYRLFWAARAAAKLTRIRMHDLRHSLASGLISKGATLAEVGGVLNHISPQSTKRYSHLYPERARELINRLPGRKKA